MPRSRHVPAIAAGLLLLLCAAPRAELLELDAMGANRWSVGTFVSTYAGPSHANLLQHVNRMMLVNGSEPGFAFDDFDVGTPLGLRLHWNISPPISYSATYVYSQYFSKESFTPHQWDSDRSLTTDLHELVVTLHYGLSFVKSKRVLPYLGVGLDFAFADSELSIDLVNAPQVGPDGQDSMFPYPNKSFAITSSNFAIGAVAKAGLNYAFSQRISVTAEIQGILNQVRQTFEYEGSLQYISPTTPQETIEDPKVNDILTGSYPLDMNGLRLAIGVLVGL